MDMDREDPQVAVAALLEEQPYFIKNQILVTVVKSSELPELDDTRIDALIQRVHDIIKRSRGTSDDCITSVRRLEPLSLENQGQAERVGGEEEKERESERGTSTHQQVTRFPPLPETFLLEVTDAPNDRFGRDSVTLAVDAINQERAALRIGEVATTFAGPNWILSSANGSPNSGPGTDPKPAPAGAWRLIAPPAGAWQDRRRRRRRVVVAVLDTWPDLDSLARARARYGQANNSLMWALAKPAAVRLFPSAAPVPALKTHAQVDHGLFVSSIIRRIAPHAELWVFQVLDDRGVGRTDVLLTALDQCILLARTGTPVVVNLSLYLRIPPDDARGTLSLLWRRGDPRTDRDVGQLQMLDEAVRIRVALLREAGAVVVAAVGNDGFSECPNRGEVPVHLQPRVPADYHSAIGVVATDHLGRIATYSNRGDVPVANTCIATFGGQGRLRQIVARNDLPDVEVDGSDGVVGLYTAQTIETEGDNTSGWVYWSGTSFATPMISGITANLLAEKPGLTTAEALTELYGMAIPQVYTDRDLECPYVPVYQARW